MDIRFRPGGRTRTSARSPQTADLTCIFSGVAPMSQTVVILCLLPRRIRNMSNLSFAARFWPAAWPRQTNCETNLPEESSGGDIVNLLLDDISSFPRVALCLLPPLEHSQRPKRVPAAGCAEPFQLEIRLALIAVLQQPVAVLALAAPHNLDCIGEALVARCVDPLEIVQSAKDVVVPARWEGEPKENRLDDLARSVGPKQLVYQEEFTAAALRSMHLLRYASSLQFVESQTFQDTDGCMHG